MKNLTLKYKIIIALLLFFSICLTFMIRSIGIENVRDMIGYQTFWHIYLHGDCSQLDSDESFKNKLLLAKDDFFMLQHDIENRYQGKVSTIRAVPESGILSDLDEARCSQRNTSRIVKVSVDGTLNRMLLLARYGADRHGIKFIYVPKASSITSGSLTFDEKPLNEFLGE